MDSPEMLIGLVAAFCTTVANVPQVKKTWQTGTADDLSFKMLVLLMAGVGLWVIYGAFKADVVIMVANGASFLLLAIILCFKVRGPANSAPQIPPPNAARVVVPKANETPPAVATQTSAQQS